MQASEALFMHLLAGQHAILRFRDEEKVNKQKQTGSCTHAEAGFSYAITPYFSPARGSPSTCAT